MRRGDLKSAAHEERNYSLPPMTINCVSVLHVEKGEALSWRRAQKTMELCVNVMSRDV